MPAEPVDPAIIYGNIGRCPACRHPIRFGSRRDPIEIAQALRRWASVYDCAARKNSPSRTEAAGPNERSNCYPLRLDSSRSLPNNQRIVATRPTSSVSSSVA